MGASDRMRALLVNGIKELCHNIPLSKISVNNIIEHCEINRSTFYYHFNNKYELINHVYHWEVTVPLRKKIEKGPEHWKETTLMSLTLMHKSKPFYCQAFKMSGQNSLTDFALGEVKENWRLIAKDICERSYPNSATNFDSIFYVSDYQASGAFSMMQNWVLGGMKEDPEKLAILLDTAASMGVEETIKYLANNPLG